MDAARHMHKMGAEKSVNHHGLNVLRLIERTGRLAAFLSEIEDVTVVRNAMPMYCVGGDCPPDQVPPHHLSKAKAHHLIRRHVSKLAALQKREAEITASINQLMKNIAHGDPITGETNAETRMKAKAAEKVAASNAGAELQAQLNDAADKEDKARIVEAAGNVAQKKIMKTMNKAIDKAHKPETHASAARPVNQKDLVLPINTLQNHVAGYVNHKLNHVLKLFTKRHAQHKHLSMQEHKHVSKTLRSMAAHLMQKFATHHHGTQKVKPHKVVKENAKKAKNATKVHKKTKAVQKHRIKVAAQKKEVAKTPTTWAHKGAVKKEQKAMDAGNPEAPSQQGQVAAGGTVEKFIWHALGKPGLTRSEPPKTLAELLKSGVHLMNGGRLHFVLGPRE